MPSDNVYGTLQNASSVALTRGMVVRVSATNSVRRAQADSLANLQGLAGVIGSGIVGIGGPATNIVSSSLSQQVLLETGLTPAAGQTLYVSATVPGRATNVAPASFPVPIGIIGSTGSYARDSLVIAAVIMPGVTAADFAKLATVDPGMNVAQYGVTPALDLLTPQANILLIPARAGYFPAMQFRNWILEAVTGVQTAPPVVRAGNDAGHVNFIASTSTTPTNAETNSGNYPSTPAGPGFPGTTTLRIANAPVFMDIVTGAVGPTVLSARLMYGYTWMPSP